MNRIIKEFEKCSGTKDILLDFFGINSTEQYDYVIVAPSWEINKVFDKKNNNYTELFVNKDISVYDVKFSNKKFLYACLKIGAPNMVDFCLACYKLNCDKFIFVGSAGSLDKTINVGDFIIPTAAISANGATLYLHDKIDVCNFFERVEADKELAQVINNVLEKINIKYRDECVVSVDSVCAEYAHLTEFKKMGAKVIEMEYATFLKAMQLINKKAIGIIIISDNSANGMHLLSKNVDYREYYYNSRDNISKILSKI